MGEKSSENRFFFRCGFLTPSEKNTVFCHFCDRGVPLVGQFVEEIIAEVRSWGNEKTIGSNGFFLLFFLGGPF
jgi:hypothetical protein